MGDTKSLDVCRYQNQYKPPPQKNYVSGFTCQVSGVMYQLSYVMFHVSRAAYHLSPVTKPKATTTDPPTAKLPTMHSRLVCKDTKTIYFILLRNCGPLQTSRIMGRWE